MAQSPKLQAWGSQLYNSSQAPGVLEPLSVCYYGQGAQNVDGSKGQITREMEHQITRQLA